MAKKSSELFTSNWGIGVTGYASADPENEITQLFAWYSFSYNGEEISTQKIEPKETDPLPYSYFIPVRYLISF